MTTKMLHCVIFKIYYIIHGLNFKMLIRKSYLALSFGRTQVIGIGGIPIIATPFITLEKYALSNDVFPLQTFDDEYNMYMQWNL